MFCTTIVLYGVFSGVILGITDGQAERLDQHCRSLMTGKRFGWYAPFYDIITVEFTMYSDTSGTLVQITDDSGTVNYTIPEGGVRSFYRTHNSNESLLIISDADIGVSIRSLHSTYMFDMRLICVPDTLSQHFMTTYSGYNNILTIMSLEAENDVQYNRNSGAFLYTIRLQERGVLYLSGSRDRHYVVCSGSCVAYQYWPFSEQRFSTSPVMPVQFYPSDYFIKNSLGYQVFCSSVQRGNTLNLTTEFRHFQRKTHFWSWSVRSYQTGFVRCTTGCVTRIKNVPQHNRFYSPPESTNSSFIRSTGNKWIIVFDYSIEVERTFEEVYSLQSISPSGSNQMNISTTEFVNNRSTNDVYKYVFVEATSGVYRISNISYIRSSAIYVQDVTDEGTFIIPLYYTSYPSKTVDLCQRPINLCGSGEVCVNKPESFNYSCVQDIDECVSNPCQNIGSCIDGIAMFSCLCMEGFTGVVCETEINECHSNTCLNEGNCTFGLDRFSCSCMEGFTGYSCEEDIDDCETNRCLNNGTCVDGVNSFTCQCIEGYENGDLGICEIVEDAVPGYSWWREGGFKECTHLQTSTYNVTNIQECGIKCNENEEFCSAFVFGQDERCTLTKAICESQDTSGNLFFRKDIEFVRLSSFSFAVFMDKKDAENSKHHFIGLKIENIGDYTQERDAELRRLVESKQDTLVELLYQSQFVIDVNLDRLESGSVVAVYDVLLNNIDGATLLNHVSNTLAEFRISSGFQIDENSLLDYASDGCSKLSDFCLNGGTCVNAPEGAVYCQCPAAFNGDKCQNPVVNVTSIFPIRGSGPFGPESGGTRITMMGSHLNLTGPPVVNLEGFVCPLNSSSHVSIVCQTARAVRPAAIGTELSITLSWPPQDHPLPQGKLETAYNFLYLKDPNISTVFPLKTIAAGGVDLTITGENMDSVAVPVMEMLVFTGDTMVDVFYEVCELRSPTVFVCPTAHLNLTEANVRRKREAEPRERYTFNGEEVEIQINFFLDGVQEFRNMSEARPEYSTIVVFIDPQMEPSTEVETFRPFWPFGDEFITRTGFHLLDGLKESQYKAFVGTDQCTEVSVDTNSISCRAPRSEPEKSNEFYDHPELVIVVGRGRLSFQCGSINYEEHLLEYRPVQIATGAAVFLVILVVGVIILCCRYKRKMLKNRPSDPVDGVEPADVSISSPQAIKVRLKSDPIDGVELSDVSISRQQAAKTKKTEPPTGDYVNEEITQKEPPTGDYVNEEPGYVNTALSQSSPGECQNWTSGAYENTKKTEPSTGDYVNEEPGYVNTALSQSSESEYQNWSSGAYENVSR